MIWFDRGEGTVDSTAATRAVEKSGRPGTRAALTHSEDRKLKYIGFAAALVGLHGTAFAQSVKPVVNKMGTFQEIQAGDTLVDGQNRKVAYQTQFEITDYCTAAEIASNISTCAQAAINAAQATASVSFGGVMVHFSGQKSPYQLTGAPLRITSSFVGLVGDTTQGTFINCANGSSDCIVIGQATGSGIRDNVIRDLGVWGSGKTGGAGLHIYNSYRTLVQHVDLENMVRGVDVETNTNSVTLEHATIVVNQPASDYGIYWHAPADGSSRSDVLTFNDVVIDGQWSNATGWMWSGLANTAGGSSLRILHMNYGIRVVNPVASSSFAPSFLNIHDLELEGFKTRALSIEAGYEFRITGSDITNLAGSNGNADDYAVACYADTAGTITRGLMISNTRIGDSRKSGLYSECRGTQLDNVQFFTTSYAGTNLYPVIQLASTAQDSSFTNIVCEEFGGSARASNCLNIASGAANIRAVNFVTNYINSTWISDPGGAALTNAPRLSIGTFNPAVDGAHSGMRVDQNTDTIFKVANGATGTNAAARYDWSTGTPNAYAIAALKDNAGSPYWQFSTGSGVGYTQWTSKLGLGTFNPSTAGASYGMEIDQNSDTIFKVVNGAVGSLVSSRFDQSTGTPNSYAIFALKDNNSVPYYQIGFGSAVKAVIVDLPIQQVTYNYAVPLAGTSVTIGDRQDVAILNPSNSLATLTITLPTCSALYDGKRAGFSTTRDITALTMNATAGTVNSPFTTATAGQVATWRCVGSTATWFRSN